MTNQQNRQYSMKRMGEFVKRARLASGIRTLTELAEASGNNQSYISNLESGKETGSLDALIRVARAMHLRPGLLIDIYAGYRDPGLLDPLEQMVLENFKLLTNKEKEQFHTLVKTWTLGRSPFTQENNDSDLLEQWRSYG